MPKEKQTYYFAVEGSTECLYLNHLQKLINNVENADYCVSIKCESKAKDLLSFVKGNNFLYQTTIYVLCDVESPGERGKKNMCNTIDGIVNAMKARKQVKFVLGYSNLSFELFMVLHHQDCSGGKQNVKAYLPKINTAYGKSFQSIDTYKEKVPFESVLSNITLENVRQAVTRAKAITKQREDHGAHVEQYRNYKYYTDNPSLSIHTAIGKILSDCKML